MAIELVNKTNTEAAGGDYPYGDVRDKTVSLAGTIWDRNTMSDYIQFFHKMMAEAGVTYNGLLDNDYNGWQFYEAFRILTKPYKVYEAIIAQSGGGAPSVVVLGNNEIGAIVWTRDSTGYYIGTLSGAFTSNKTQIFVMGPAFGAATPTIVGATRLSNDTVGIKTWDDAGTLTDGLLVGPNSLTIKVFD